MVLSSSQKDTGFHSKQRPHDAIVQTLQKRIHRVETAQRIDPGEVISSGCQPINQLLPGGGYAKGTLVQWLSSGGHGADYLSLLTAREACRDGGALVVIDPHQQFYPPAAAALGINMGNLIVLRPPTPQHQSLASDSLSSDWLWSIDQALRCAAVGAVWGALPNIDERWFRRFQLSAESSGCLGLFLQSLQEARKPSWAEVQWLISGTTASPRQSSRMASRRSSESQLAPESQLARAAHAKTHGVSIHDANIHGAKTRGARHQQLQIQMTRCRGARTGKKLSLEIDTVTGSIQTVHSRISL